MGNASDWPAAHILGSGVNQIHGGVVFREELGKIIGWKRREAQNKEYRASVPVDDIYCTTPGGIRVEAEVTSAITTPIIEQDSRTMSRLGEDFIQATSGLGVALCFDDRSDSCYRTAWMSNDGRSESVSRAQHAAEVPDQLWLRQGFISSLDVGSFIMS